ncbi:DUF748 domain-containing protein [Pseudomonas sp. B392_1p]|uniref:DUF748 domain-containing protein n=1 Tax=Pseudomonas sp. B392_1p TaxID=3457507 RepID=UPI003FD12693
MSKGLIRTGWVLLVALLVYSLIGFLILPGIALRIANQQLAQYATVPATLERLEFNPFTLTLDLHNLRLGEAEAPQAAFEALHVDLEWDSLWQRTLHLADVRLLRPHSEILFAKDGSLNLAQLFELPTSEAPEPAETEPSEPFPLRIDRLLLERGLVHFQDQRPSEPIDFVYDPLDFELHNLATRVDGDADASLSASGPDGGNIAWQGRFDLSPFTSEGRFQVTDLTLKTFWPYVQDMLPLHLQQGALNLHSDYRLDLSETTQLQLSNARVQLAPFAIDGPDGQPLLRLEDLDAQQVSLDLAEQRVVIGQLRSTQLEAWASREADGQINWQTLLAGDETPTSDDAADSESGKPWQVLLQDGQLRGYRVHLTDRVPEQDVELLVGPLDVDVQQLDSLGQSPFQLRLDTGLGEQGRLHAEGEVQLSPVSARLKVNTQDIDLRLAQAYLSPFVRLELRSGQLASELDVRLDSIEPLAMQITGNAEVDQLHTLDTLKERDFVKWQRLQLQGLDYRHGDSLNIASIDLNEPYARFIIYEDLTTNVAELIVEQPADPAATPASDTDAPPLGIQIGAIVIHSGSANFADFSLQPNFATAIQELNGTVGTLDNRAQQPAAVNITGKVDRYAPVSITGRLTPFDPLHSLDIATSFKNVELTTLTPYSGKFAGYRIRKGRLNLDLHYRIEQGRLNAENHVLLENLQLGERVDSPSAVDLPVRLAVALLKDTQGNIDIALPIQGDLNNPEFSVMPIIWQTLRNLVLRAVQAPFKFIAGLVSGGDDDDLSQISFAAGSSELDSRARQRLDALAAALKQRPALRLEIEGSSAAASDGPLLAERRLQREYQDLLYKSLQRRGKNVPDDPTQLEVDEDTQSALLGAIYRSRLQRQPPAEWQELDDQERAERMRQEVLASWADNPAQLRRLSQQRAASIKDYLVDQGGLEDRRVYLLDTVVGEAQETGEVATLMHLDSE